MCTGEIVVRTARKDDLVYVYNIEVASFDNPYPYPYLEILFNLAPEYFLVAECREGIVGYVSALVRTDGRCHIVSIAVDPSHREKKIGSILLQSIMHICSCNGYRRYILEVEYTNTPAKRLYESNGFKTIGSIADYYGPGRHADVMEAEDYSYTISMCDD